MTDIESSCCELIDGGRHKCHECGQEPRIAQRTRAGVVRFCLRCAKVEHNLTHGISDALLRLLAEERRWAATIADELFSGPAQGADDAPWASSDAEQEPYTSVSTDFLGVEMDPMGLSWVTSKGKNYGGCGECGARIPDLLGMNVNVVRGTASLELTCCRPCAVRLLGDAAALRLAVLEAEAADSIRAVRASHDAQREELGFVPVVWLPTVAQTA